MIELREYLASEDRSPFARWFNDVDAQAAIRIAVALGRMEMGNLSNVKSVGEGVSEYRIDFGPGDRIYFGCDGATLLILLGGGTKKRQQRDIEAAKVYWAPITNVEEHREQFHGVDEIVQRNLVRAASA